MHELSVSSAIVDTAVRHASGRRITAVDTRIGSLRQVVPDSLAFYFEIVSRDTPCEGAELRQQVVSALLCCGGCGHEWDPAPPPTHDAEPVLPRFRCPECEAADAEVIAGNELEVESIEVTDDPPAQSPPDIPQKAEV